MNNKHEELVAWTWADLASFFGALEATDITADNVEAWLKEWSYASAIGDEIYNRLYVAASVNTADESASGRLEAFMADTYPNLKSAEQKLKEKLISSGLHVKGMEIQLRNMRSDAQLFREENLALEARAEKLNSEHDKIMGAQVVDWQGEKRTARQMEAVLWHPDRETRRTSWEKLAERQLADREAINHGWVGYMKLRGQIAANAGEAGYRDYRWKQMLRFDYSPDDCKSFHRAIEEAVVPAVNRLMERRRRAVGDDHLHYYDIFFDLSGRPALYPFKDARELTDKAASIFNQVDPVFGSYFRQMDQEGLLDLANRPNKASGAYCTQFSHAKRPFIFANAVGIHDDVQSVLHEGGHAFHAFESFKLPYFHQYAENNLPMEFAEVASMGMEFLCLPYLDERHGGFYSLNDADRARVDHIESMLIFWPYMAIVDAFQHWVYEHPQDGGDPDKCDQKWAELERRFRPHLDWSGYEEIMMTGWQRKDHIHQAPFYYIEYGLALLGAVQIWANAIKDQAGTVKLYRQALALGGTATLPDLFRAAGVKLAFDAATLKTGVDLMERTILELEAAY
jgi:oligoendopeptidase F